MVGKDPNPSTQDTQVISNQRPMERCVNFDLGGNVGAEPNMQYIGIKISR